MNSFFLKLEKKKVDQCFLHKMILNIPCQSNSSPQKSVYKLFNIASQRIS